MYTIHLPCIDYFRHKDRRGGFRLARIGRAGAENVQTHCIRRQLQLFTTAYEYTSLSLLSRIYKHFAGSFSIFAAVCNQTHTRPSLLLSPKPSLRPTSVARCSKPQLLAPRRTSANLTNARSTSSCDDTHAAAAQNGRKRVLLILLPITTRRRTTAPRAVELARPSPCKQHTQRECLTCHLAL